ncbi:MAG: hypothetical protein K2W82_04960 [Candidatus Obscuribacterales bacterium]|nr:hypothetical protein [Candidatus Obscuribacterales bacterium]
MANMTANEEKFNFDTQRSAGTSAKTIDLQGVAAFAGLVELLAQELGTTPGRIQGQLPSGPSSFEQLVGEIPITSQGYQRHVTLFTTPGQPLIILVTVGFRDPAAPEVPGQPQKMLETQLVLPSPVEKILPQGRALARHLEELFSVLDRMATLGMSSRLSAMSISEAELARFEHQQADNLVNKAAFPQRSETLR